MMTENAQFVEQAKIAWTLASVTPSSSKPKYVSLKDYERVTAVIKAVNATTVTGSAITLLQATDINNANSDEKAVAFTSAYRTLDVATNGDALTAFTVSSNTFTTDATNSKNNIYVIEITPDMLDIANGFDCVRVGAGNATATSIDVEMILWPAKYGKTSPPTAEAN